MTSWSKPVTVAAGGGPGHVLPHVIVGDPGKLDIAYWTGQQDGADIYWYTTIAQVLKGLTSAPAIHQTRVSNISTDTGTASVLMGACSQDPGTGGVENGVVCNRSADVWGIALTTICNLSISWPVRNNANHSLEATYATTQVSGTRICKTRP